MEKKSNVVPFVKPPEPRQPVVDEKERREFERVFGDLYRDESPRFPSSMEDTFGW